MNRGRRMPARMLGIALLFLLIAGQAQATGNVLMVDMKGTITPASDDILSAALERARAEDSLALILLLDTPGGGLAETTEILRLIDESKIPVIGYVHPEGAVAWSAGTIILIGTDLAAMAPHTIIGSAQPVQLSPTGGTVPVNDSKTTNAIVALIEEKARKHGRNTTAAREFVLSNLNLNADEAKSFRVIEHIASSPEELMDQINGTRIKNTTLITQGADLKLFEPPINLLFLKLLSDPTIAGLLMLIGLYSLIYGFSSPGMGAEVFGLTALALGLIGLGFNVNVGAIFLILLGLGLILAELHSHTFGALAVAGLICVIVGSILFVPTSFPEWYVPGSYQRSMALALILPSLILGLFMAFAIYKVALARFAPVVVDVFEGEEAVALDRLDPKGYVLFQGEYWQAEAEGTVEMGEKVTIMSREGSKLRVMAKQR
ncbi:nodulation protein NfeD [Methanothrix sp.]|uniref:NfeD family protein n=2 Tax=Methanothrix sp. TaxID=90426 RepID=UPI00316AEC78